MADVGLEVIEPNDLYNMLQQGTDYSSLTDPNYLLLIDARIKSEYNESHVMTAKKAPKDEHGFFMVPYDAELDCKQNVVVYDNNTQSYTNNQAPAVMCAQLFWNRGSRNPVKIVRGGYEKFSQLYPFLRTQKIIYMPRELEEIKPYPVEIVEGSLYLGNWYQGNAPPIQKDLKIKAHINLCIEVDTFFKQPGDQLLYIPIHDDNIADLFCNFEATFSFIDEHMKRKEAVLVFSTLGISRSATIIIAYLMKQNMWPLELAYQHACKCQTAIRPNRTFVQQLSMWEEKLFGACSTNVADPNF